jgi:hypothetical protein
LVFQGNRLRGTLFLMNHHWYLCDCQGYVTGITKKSREAHAPNPALVWTKLSPL